MGKFLDSLHRKLMLTDKKNYYREQYQSFMTGPEWRNVEMAEEYGRYLRDGNSMFNFPYFRQVWDLWKVVFKSYSAARKYDGALKIINSEYMVMDIFVATFTTLELIPKGIISLFLKPFLNKKNFSPIQAHLASYYQEYGANLQTIPFYDHKYKEIRLRLSEAYQKCKRKTWVDWFSWKTVAIELWAREWISKPLSYWFHQEDNLVPATTDILVKYTSQNAVTAEGAIEDFKKRLSNQDSSTVDDKVLVKAKESNGMLSVYARLRVPRYAAFQTTLKALEVNEIKVRKMAGQDRVQVKTLVTANKLDVVENYSHHISQKLGVTAPIYTYGDGINPGRRFCLFDVPVRNLGATLQRVDEANAIYSSAETKFIHNF